MDVIMLLTMSLSGTAAFAVYSVLIRLLNERISATSQYICMKFCLLFYLVPFPLGKYLLSRCLPRKLEPLLLDGTIIKLQGNYVQAPTVSIFTPEFRKYCGPSGWLLSFFY